MKKGCGLLMKHSDEIFFRNALPEGDFWNKNHVIPIGIYAFKMIIADSIFT